MTSQQNYPNSLSKIFVCRCQPAMPAIMHLFFLLISGNRKLRLEMDVLQKDMLDLGEGEGEGDVVVGAEPQ